MKQVQRHSGFPTWLMAALLSALAAACGGDGGRDPILGGAGAIFAAAPTVTAVAPLANATGVPINIKIITAAFSKAMDPATLTTASFTLACPAGTPVTGAVTYLAAGNVATLTLPAAPNLPLSTVCTGTITTAARDTTTVALANNFVWTFTTGATQDLTRPRVSITVPATTIPGPTAGAATNTAITAVFTEDMAPATITAAGTFTVTCAAPCVSPAGAVVTYVVGSRTATFTPAAVLAAGATYTATITTAATDVASNALAGNPALPLAANNYVWTFTTAAAAPAVGPSVLSTNPAAGAGASCANSSINATFTVPSGLRMDPATLTTLTFTVAGPGVTPVPAASVVLDGATGLIATFTPQSSLTSGVMYTATLKGGATGVKDLAIPGNQMASDFTWTFTAGPATANCQAPLVLNAAAPFGSLTCAALVGSTAPPTGTTVNGDIGTTATSTSITNFVGGGVPATPGIVNGTIFASDLPTPGNTTSSTAIGNANTARLQGETAGASGALVSTADLGAQVGFGPAAGTYLPGAYRSGSSMQINTPITLDAQGNANATWIFFMPVSTLTTTGTGNVLLANGAQSKNIFWVVGSSATLGAPLFNGSILAATAISVATVPTTVNGRLLTSGPTCAAVTFDANLHTVNVPQ